MEGIHSGRKKPQPGRVPLSFAVHDKGLTTVIGRIGKDAYGRNIPLNTKLQMLRLRKWQIRSRVHSSADRNLAQAMAELDRLCDKLHIPVTIKERAAVIFEKPSTQALFEGAVSPPLQPQPSMQPAESHRLLEPSEK